MRCHDFDLQISGSGGHVCISVVNAPEGYADVVHDWRFSPEQLAGLTDLQTSRPNPRPEQGHIIPPAKNHSTGPAKLRRQPFAAIFPQDVYTTLSASPHRVTREEGAGLCIRLQFLDDASDLPSPPWEALFDPQGDRFLALAEHVTT